MTLKEHRQFVDLKQSGRFLKAEPWLTINYKRNTNKGLRVGFTISGKVTNAVVRNRLKRWCKSYFQRKTKTNLDINLIFRAVNEKDHYKQLRSPQLYKSLDAAWDVVYQRSFKSGDSNY